MPASFPFGSSLDLDHFVKELFMTYLVQSNAIAQMSADDTGFGGQRK